MTKGLSTVRMMVWARAIGVLAGLVFAGAAAFADPPTAADALMDIQKYYRANPTCERMQAEVRFPAPGPAAGSGAGSVPSTRTVRSSLVVRLQPGQPDPASPPASAAVALELGPLRAWASDGVLTAVHSRNPSTYFQADINHRLTSAALGSVLPPVLIPELDLACAPGDVPCSAFWPYATRITWDSVDVDAKQPTRRTIHGTCREGMVTLAVQGQRLRSLTIDIPKKKTTLTLSFSPFAPCEPAKAAIDTAHRERVASLEDLQPRLGTLRVGVRVPPMPITQAAGKGWDLGALLRPPAELAEMVSPADLAVLVFLRDRPAAAGPASQRFNPDQLAPILKQMRAESFKPRPAKDADKDAGPAMARFGYAPVLVLNSPSPEDVLRRFNEASQKWGPDVLWTTEPKSTIDLFAPGADAACVILDSEYVLRAVIIVDPGQTAEQIADQVAATLFELAPADGSGK